MLKFPWKSNEEVADMALVNGNRQAYNPARITSEAAAGRAADLEFHRQVFAEENGAENAATTVAGMVGHRIDGKTNANMVEYTVEAGPNTPQRQQIFNQLIAELAQSDAPCTVQVWKQDGDIATIVKTDHASLVQMLDGFAARGAQIKRTGDRELMIDPARMRPA